MKLIPLEINTREKINKLVLKIARHNNISRFKKLLDHRSFFKLNDAMYAIIDNSVGKLTP